MPIKIQNDLPVKEILENENLFVVDENTRTGRLTRTSDPSSCAY